MDNQKNQITVIGETNFRNVKRKFGIKTDDRRRHTYMIGKTGMGKSNLMETMIIQDIWAGNGVAVIDPHGDTVERILEFIPTERINDVIYFNPSDMEFPIAFNVLEQVEPKYKHLVSSGLVGVFKKMWADSWGPRLEYLLRNAILALLEFPDSTLLGITRILIDKEYRSRVLLKVTDPVVKSFWVKEFASYSDKFATEAISPIQNKVGQFLSVALIRNIVGQVKSSFSLREIMDSEKILLVNLSKGRIGEDIAHMIGAMMITKLYLAAMSRVDIPEYERKDFYLYVDEFQNFATESFADILSEARKYHLCLNLAHQYMDQLTEEVRNAILGNIGTMILFRIGSRDAEVLIKEFEPLYEVTDLICLAKYQIYLKLMIDGVASDPFSASVLPPFPNEFKTNNVNKIVSVSRERYSKTREVIEEKIRRWSEIEEPCENPLKLNKNFEAVCSNCNIPTKVTFKPDGVRPIYCKDCLRLIREKLMKRASENKKEEISQEKNILEVENNEDTNENLSLSEIKTDDFVSFGGNKKKIKNNVIKEEDQASTQGYGGYSKKDSEEPGKCIEPGEIIKF